jgi:hypothetical protein
MTEAAREGEGERRRESLPEIAETEPAKCHKKIIVNSLEKKRRDFCLTKLRGPTKLINKNNSFLIVPDVVAVVIHIISKEFLSFVFVFFVLLSMKKKIMCICFYKLRWIDRLINLCDLYRLSIGYDWGIVRLSVSGGDFISF